MKRTDLTGLTIPEALTLLDPTWRIKLVPSMGKLRPWLVTGPTSRPRRVRPHVKPLPLP